MIVHLKKSKPRGISQSSTTNRYLSEFHSLCFPEAECHRHSVSECEKKGHYYYHTSESKVCWCTLVTSVLWRMKQENGNAETSLDYLVRPGLNLSLSWSVSNQRREEKRDNRGHSASYYPTEINLQGNEALLSQKVNYTACANADQRHSSPFCLHGTQWMLTPGMSTLREDCYIDLPVIVFPQPPSS